MTERETKDIATAQRPAHDLDGIYAALLRAAADAKRLAEQTNTPLVVSKNSTLAERWKLLSKT